MRVLIVGAGIAGLTLAARLRAAGAEPTVVERQPRFRDSGYGLGLYRPASRALEDLGVYDEFLERGKRINAYDAADGRGRMLQSVPMDLIPEEITPFVMIRRSDLVELLRQGCGDVPLLMGRTVAEIKEVGGEVHADLDDGGTLTAEALVSCDGGNAAGRRWMPSVAKTVDSGWGYWSWWGPEGLVRSDALIDFCGRGWFLGAYPVPGRCMFGLGVPRSVVSDPHTPVEGMRRIAADTMASLIAARPEIGEAVEAAETFYAWPMRDVRSPHWAHGRVALCGDAAATSIPSAGLGASHAIQSATVLAEELSRVGPADVPQALARYAERCKSVVNRNVRESRLLAKATLTRSRTATWVRDQLMERYPAKGAIEQIAKTVNQRF